MARTIAAIATGISSASQGWMASSRTRPIAATTRRAERGDPAEVAGDLGLVALHVVADQGEQGRHQHDHRADPAEPWRRR